MTKKAYSRADYLAFAEEHTVDFFYRCVSELETIVSRQGWQLDKFFQSQWCSFKPSEDGLAAFGIAFESGKNRVYLYIKRIEPDASHLEQWARFNKSYDQLEFLIEPRGARLEAFLPLLERAYRLLE